MPTHTTTADTDRLADIMTIASAIDAEINDVDDPNLEAAHHDAQDLVEAIESYWAAEADVAGPVSWFRVRFPDRGSGATRCHAFVQGRDADHARDLAGDHDHFRMFDTDAGKVTPLADRSRRDVEDSVTMATGPNVALDATGDLIRRSDLGGDD